MTGRHRDAVPLLNTALGALDGRYDRDRARYAAVLALALAGVGEADAALSELTEHLWDITATS